MWGAGGDDTLIVYIFIFWFFIVVQVLNVFYGMMKYGKLSVEYLVVVEVFPAIYGSCFS